MRFTAKITRDISSNWKCVVWEQSFEALGTGKSVKVEANIDGCRFQATSLPIGGMHMLPLRATVLKTIKRDVGALVTVDIEVIYRSK